MEIYLAKYQRKFTKYQTEFGDGDWETVFTNIILEDGKESKYIENLITLVPLSDITENSISLSTLRDVFGIHKKGKGGSIKYAHDWHYKSYKRYNPYVSLRVVYIKTTVSLEKLFEMSDCEKVIQYLAERGINYPAKQE